MNAYVKTYKHWRWKMEPLCNFDNKEMAFLYYVEVCRMSPMTARHFIDENWDKTRGDGQ